MSLLVWISRTIKMSAWVQIFFFIPFARRFFVGRGRFCCTCQSQSCIFYNKKDIVQFLLKSKFSLYIFNNLADPFQPLSKSPHVYIHSMIVSLKRDKRIFFFGNALKRTLIFSNDICGQIKEVRNHQKTFFQVMNFFSHIFRRIKGKPIKNKFSKIYNAAATQSFSSTHMKKILHFY